MKANPNTGTTQCRMRDTPEGPRCGRPHKLGLFACAQHWHQLPKTLQDAIWKAFRGKGVLSSEYVQAAENAKAHLEGREARDVGDVIA